MSGEEQSKIEKFALELAQVAVAIRKGKEDGRVGLIDVWRIGREIKDVIVLLPNILGFPDELKDMSDDQIQELVNDMYIFVQQSDGPNLENTIDKENVIHALKGIKHFASID